ncbi:MAG: ABC transporter ATP-binding protein [Kiritimatiellae bacterium]|nr:ABC transporter ATP-binding protein [Kiritimatiellia bacterium]
MAISYKKEFFDRDYTVREAYARVWKYARRYKFRLIIGVVCGMLTAGTLVPFFQIVQPTLQHVESHDREAAQPAAVEVKGDEKPAKKPGNVFEKQIARNSRLPSWYPKVEKFAAKLGIELQNEKGGMGGALLLIVCLVVPLVALARLALLYLNHYCLSWSGAHAVADIRQELLEHVQKQGLQFFGRVDVGQLMTRIAGDPQQIQVILSTILSEVAMAPFEIFVAVGFIIWFAVTNDMLPTLLLIVVGFPLFVLPVQMLGKKIKKWARRSMERWSMIGTKIHEILTCIKVVKSYNTEDFENRRYAATNRYLLKSTMRGLRIGLMVGPTVETIGIILICFFLVWCFAMDVKISDVVPMLAPLLIIYKPVKQLSKLQVQVETSMAALSRIYSVLDLKMELPESASALHKASFDDRISFDAVTFKYETADVFAVKNASFEIPQGKMVAVVGGTGSGKSTMAGLLARFFDPESGKVTMDGVDLRNIKVADLRRLIGAVTQEALLFNDTIEENIRYGTPEATHEQVVAAAKLANAHDFIMSQPEGYNRVVGEKGFALSGGERQRIAIARAILRNPPVLILDEATSALDTLTERLVQDALTNLMKDRTVFAIAHRLSTIRHADMILVMDHGEIVERGTHGELYALNGVYRKLCDMQLAQK